MFTPQLLLYGMAALIFLICLPGLASPKHYRKEITKIAKDEKLIRVLSINMLLIGFLFLSVQWRFERDAAWMILIPLFGWLTILKGIVYLWYPGFVKGKVKIFFGNDSNVTIWSMLGIILAATLVYVTMNYVTLGEIVAG